MCRPCRAAYKREHYLANKERYVRQAGLRKEVLRRKRTAYLLDYFATHPCQDCGESDPVVLEFDHLDGETKLFNISHALPYRGWQSILDEIEKCEVVCANCHRRRTAHRNGAMRVVLSAEATDRD
jgi:5-methylcytosine-specific restriction endonuclease McrA